MRTLAGPDASIAFTHLSRAASASLSAAFDAPPPSPSTTSSPRPDPVPTTPAHAECHEQGVLSLMQARNIPLDRVCLLDPKSPTALSPPDGDGAAPTSTSKFTWFLFGVASQLFFFPLSFRLFALLNPPPFFWVLVVFFFFGVGLGYPRYGFFLPFEESRARASTLIVFLIFLFSSRSEQVTTPHEIARPSYARSVSRRVISVPYR